VHRMKLIFIGLALVIAVVVISLVPTRQALVTSNTETKTLRVENGREVQHKRFTQARHLAHSTVRPCS